DGRRAAADRAAVVRTLSEAADRCLRQAERHAGDRPEGLNGLAWFLATAPLAEFRDPDRAVTLAERAVEREPKAGEYWNTLGVAGYRAGRWDDAIAALQRSMALRSGGDAYDWFVLAMSHRQKGEDGPARAWFDRALAWREKNQPQDTDLDRFHAESAALL